MQTTNKKCLQVYLGSRDSRLLAAITTLPIVEPLSIFGIGSYLSLQSDCRRDSGAWFFTGYISFRAVGAVAMAVAAIFYSCVGRVMGKVFQVFTNYLAWGHLLLANIGVTGSMFLILWVGCLAG
jgi:hypothetical protein